jgi:hypothetical protein
VTFDSFFGGGAPLIGIMMGAAFGGYMTSLLFAMGHHRQIVARLDRIALALERIAK